MVLYKYVFIYINMYWFNTDLLFAWCETYTSYNKHVFRFSLDFGLFESGKMTFVEVLDMYFIVFYDSCEYFINLNNILE